MLLVYVVYDAQMRVVLLALSTCWSAYMLVHDFGSLHLVCPSILVGHNAPRSARRRRRCRTTHGEGGGNGGKGKRKRAGAGKRKTLVVRNRSQNNTF